MPFKQLDAALQDYARCSCATTGRCRAGRRAPAAATPIAAAPAPADRGGPGSAALMRLPQDEMTPIVQRFITPARRSADAAAAVRRRPCRDQQPRRGPAEAVLRRLARGAEVARLRPAVAQRAGRLPVHPARAAETISRPRRRAARSRTRRARPTHRTSRAPPRGRAGLIQDLADEMIPYTPEQLIALADKEFAWCDEEMQQGVARRWDSATTGSRRSRRSRGMHVDAGRAAGGHPRHARRGGRLPARERPDHRARRRQRVAAHDR